MTRTLSATWMATVVLAGATASAETFYSKEGVVFEGTLRRVVPAAAVCNVLKEKYTPEEYERLKGNQGAPLDLWQVDFTIRNKSGRPIEYLRATAWLHSEDPPCTNWSGEGPGRAPVMPEPSLLVPTVWSDYYAPIQMPYGMRINQQKRHSVYLVAFSGQLPRFGEWKIDYEFEATAEAQTPSGGVSRARRSGAPAAAGELPPEVQMDLNLRRAEQAAREGAAATARQAMESVASLQQEYGLEPSPEDHYRYAQAWAAAGEPHRATEAAVRYLQTGGRDAERYTEALDLINREGSLEAAPRTENVAASLAGPGAKPSCVGQPKGVACWMELANQPGCHVWNRSLSEDDTASWSGACGSGLAEGTGTYAWKSDSQEYEATGLMRAGKGYGHWVVRLADGTVAEGPFVDGAQHGHWVYRDADGTVSEGPLVDGAQHGHWVYRFADGEVHEGPFANGLENGHWVLRPADGSVRQGPYVDGEKHGRWIEREADGTTDTVTYINGEKQ